MEASSLSGMLKSLFLLNIFFCLGTQPSQFIEVLNTRVFRPYQHVMYENKIDYATRRNIYVSEVPCSIDTAAWRHFLHQLVWFSLAFPLDSFSRTARTRSHVKC